MRLRSGDPREAPAIRFNYMAEESDWRDFRAAVRLTREVFAQPALSRYCGEEIAPGAQRESDEALDDFVREFILLDLPMFVVREDLRSAEDAAIAPRDEDRTEAERPIDPRLMPLAELASRLRQDKE